MPDISNSELAESYGFALSFLKSNKELRHKFDLAVKHSWTPEKFIAEIKGTHWFKKNGEAARNYQLLKKSDPGTWRQKRNNTYAQIKDAAAQLGAVMSSKTLSRVTENALQFGWNDAQIRDTLAQYVHATNGVYKGAAGNDIQTMKTAAYKNGIKLSKATEESWAQSIAKGNNTADYYVNHIRTMAKTLAPAFAAQLDAGIDLQDIASPYIESKAKILEIDPAQVDLFDKDIRSALSGQTQDGKPSSKTLWQFEQDMRKDPRWLKTQNAQDSVSSVAKKILSDFGFQGVG
jgi:hypothetical protein